MSESKKNEKKATKSTISFSQIGSFFSGLLASSNSKDFFDKQKVTLKKELVTDESDDEEQSDKLDIIDIDEINENNKKTHTK